MRRRLTALALAGLALAAATGCARKQIDVDKTDSVKVEGTNWWRFCDGPNAVMWTKGLSGDSDEIEAYVYDHWACAPAYYEQNPTEARPTAEDPTRSDDDGILEGGG